MPYPVNKVEEDTQWLSLTPLPTVWHSVVSFVVFLIMLRKEKEAFRTASESGKNYGNSVFEMWGAALF